MKPGIINVGRPSGSDGLMTRGVYSVAVTNRPGGGGMTAAAAQTRKDIDYQTILKFTNDWLGITLVNELVDNPTSRKGGFT
jgi:tripartite-type tricarboxylate transporter receptor subunit TctC